MHVTNERYQQNSHKWLTWPPLTVGLPVTSGCIDLVLQVPRLFHIATVSQCDHFLLLHMYMFVFLSSTRLITRLESFFGFFTSILVGGTQLQCIYYLCCILISRPPRVFRRLKRRSCTSCYWFSPCHIRFACRNFICQHWSITQTTVKKRLSASILFDPQACSSAILSVVNW